MASPEPFSPVWWVNRLCERLITDQKHMIRMWDYYRGAHPLPFVPRDLELPYREMLARSRSNFCRRVIDAPVERLRVSGFRLSADSTDVEDRESWRLWQANKLDLGLQAALPLIQSHGRAYISVFRAGNEPRIKFESALHVITEPDPDDLTASAAALKVWYDDTSQVTRARLYLPGSEHRYKSKIGLILGVAHAHWEPDADQGPAEQTFDSRTVPFWRIANRITTDSPGASELDDLWPTQDRINKTLFDRLLASETSSFRQKWATGIQVERDEYGNPKDPFESGLDRMFMDPNPDTKFGTFEATDLKQFISAVEQDVVHLAVQSSTPRHYLIEQGQSPSGDAMRSAEAGLIAKVRRMQTEMSEPIEAAMRYARSITLPATGQAEPVDSELVWSDPEYRSEGEKVDALVKLGTLGVPPEKLWELYGFSPQEIARMQSTQQASALLAGLLPAPTPAQDDSAVA